MCTSTVHSYVCLNSKVWLAIHTNLTWFLKYLLGCLGLLDLAPLWRGLGGASSRFGSNVSQVFLLKNSAGKSGQVDGAVQLAHHARHQERRQRLSEGRRAHPQGKFQNINNPISRAGGGEG